MMCLNLNDKLYKYTELHITMTWLNLFRKLPLWAYGVECQICQMTFISAEAHYDKVQKNKTLSKHLNKIPVLIK